MGEEKRKALDCKASDNAYLHRDFHGALCYALKYLDETLGEDATREYLEQVAETCFAPLSEAIAERGLLALEEHWRRVFSTEGGDWEIAYDADGALTLTVRQCPAVAHLKSIGQFHTPRFCETTRIVNAIVCRRASYEASCEYEPGAGRCVQRVHKQIPAKQTQGEPHAQDP